MKEAGNRNKPRTEEAIPNPERLFKSIAEQGYSLESALADLIDNCLTANANTVEVLTSINNGDIQLFVADNGDGMSGNELSENMRFPSDLMENERASDDLGRFGLGMKTASFSQTRNLTVISRKKGTLNFSARTWNINRIKSWAIIVNNENEINELINQYFELQAGMIGRMDDFFPNTIICWSGMYKFNTISDLELRKAALNTQLNEVTREYLGLVFHRFMERKIKSLKIKLNNLFVEPFNPFPEDAGIRKLELEQYAMRQDVLTVQGFVLPSKAIKSKDRVYVSQFKGLMDLEGMYIYRLDRIIMFGGWLGVIKKRPNIQLARMKIDVGNASDSLLQLNVAKSSVVIPHDLKMGFLRYVVRLTDQAKKEYFNREITDKRSKNVKSLDLLERHATSRGNKVRINYRHPILAELTKQLPKNKHFLLISFLRSIETRINKIRHVHEREDFTGIVEESRLSSKELKSTLEKLVQLGLPNRDIIKVLENDLGFNFNTLPDEIKNSLKN